MNPIKNVKRVRKSKEESQPVDTLPDIKKIRTPSLMTFFCKSWGGKSTIMRYVLYSLIKDKRFDYVVVVSPTGCFNGDWSCIPERYRHETFSEELVNNLFKLQRKCIEMGVPKNCCLILDDCLGKVDFQSKIWKKLASASRQWNISIMVSFQRFFLCPTILRQNTSFVYALKTSDENTIMGLYKEFAGCFPKYEQWKDFFLKNTDNYRCILIKNDSPTSSINENFHVLKAPIKFVEKNPINNCFELDF